MGEKINRNGVEVAVGLGIGVATIAITEIGANLDQAWNSQVFEALRKHMDWFQILTSQEAKSLAYLDNRPVSTALVFGITALVGYLFTRSSRD